MSLRQHRVGCMWSLANAPMQTQAVQSRTGLGAFLAVTLISDVLLNQAYAAFQLELGSLSILQVWRSGLLVVMSLLIAGHLKAIQRWARGPYMFLLVAGGLTMTFAIKEGIQTATVSWDSWSGYGRLIYWAMAWPLLAVAASDGSVRKLLHQIVIMQGLLLAIPIWIGYFVGVETVYSSRGVTASFGVFASAKTVSGILVCAVLVALHKSVSQDRTKNYVVASFLCIALMMTYVRAAQLAFGVALVILLCGRKESRGKRGQFALLTAGVLVMTVGGYIYLVGDGGFVERWTEIETGGGSGRVGIWNLAFDTFRNGDVSSQVLGRGYSGMLELTDSELDRRIHMHSDIFDMLMVGGVAGLLLWGFRMWSAFKWHVGSMRTHSGATSLALMASYGVMSIVTGTFWATDLNVTYLAALAGLGQHCRHIQFRAPPAGRFGARSSGRTNWRLKLVVRTEVSTTP